ncbi:MAG: AraC family transcriptional regulator [Maritimibacter sp.]
MHVTYEKRLLRVLDHVYDHLDGDLSLDELADVAALSRFHFHRVFTAVTGETVAQFTRRVRLTRAANELVLTDAPLDQVARICGYPNPKSFARAFREHFAQTPSAFRARGLPAPALRLNEHGDYEMYDVSITELPARRIAGIAHKGDYMEVGRAFETAATSLAAQGHGARMGNMVGVYYDDPSSKPADELQSFAALVVDDDAEVTPPLQVQTLLGGKYAVLRYVGPYAGLAEAYSYLFGEWLPGSGEVPRDQPPYEFYENTPMDTKPEDLVTLISVALK